MSGTWRSLVARCTGGAEAAGSNPVVPTIFSSEKMQARMRTQFDDILGNLPLSQLLSHFWVGWGEIEHEDAFVTLIGGESHAVEEWVG